MTTAARSRWPVISKARIRASSASHATRCATRSSIQPSQKDGLGRMCKVHWNQYTAGLARDAKARKEASADATAPEPVETKPRRAKAKASEPSAEESAA